MQQRRFLNLLRWLGNELQIPLVAVGTAEALRAIQSDDQLANRFTPFGLPPWKYDDEYLRLLNTLEAMLPLRERSGMEEPAFAQKLLGAAEGILGEVVSLVTTAAVAAVAAGEERIRIEKNRRHRFHSSHGAPTCRRLRSYEVEFFELRRSSAHRGRCRHALRRCRTRRWRPGCFVSPNRSGSAPEALLLGDGEMGFATHPRLVAQA